MDTDHYTRCSALANELLRQQLIQLRNNDATSYADLEIIGIRHIRHTILDEVETPEVAQGLHSQTDVDRYVTQRLEQFIWVDD